MQTRPRISYCSCNNYHICYYEVLPAYTNFKIFVGLDICFHFYLSPLLNICLFSVSQYSFLEILTRLTKFNYKWQVRNLSQPVSDSGHLSSSEEVLEAQAKLLPPREVLDSQLYMLS